MSQYFDGRILTQPQAAVMVDDTRLANVNPAAANILALVGKGTAGKPQVPVLITDPNQARRVLRSGDLLDAVLLAFGASDQTGGATQIYTVRVNNAIGSKAKIFDTLTPAKASGTVTVVAGTSGNLFTVTIGGTAYTYTSSGGDTATTIANALVSAINASTLVQATNVAGVITITSILAGADGNSITLTASVSGGTGSPTATASGATLTSGTGNTLVTMTSDDWGLYTNSIYYYVAAGTTSGYKFTIGVTTSDVQGGSITQDNIARPLFSVQYTGSGTACTLTVNDTQLTTSVTGGPGAADNLTIPFATFQSVQSVVDYINNQGGKYTATVTSGAGSLASAAQFDPASALDIKTTAKTLNGHLAALVDFINSDANPFSSAVRATSPATATPAYNTNAIFFMGGSDGTTSAGDWSNAINSLQTIDAYVVVPLTEDASIHASVSTHVTFMSGAGRKPRVGIVGGALGEYVATANVPTSAITTRAQNLGSKRMTVVSPGIYVFDSKGVKTLKSAAFLAAMYGAMACALPQGVPLTHKWFSNIQGLEVTFGIGDKDALLNGGVACVEYVQGRGYRVVQSKTTWNGAPNYGKNEFSTLAAIDAVVRRVQDTLDEQLVGGVVSPLTLAQAMSITETVLMQCADDGFIVGDAKNKAFKNISVGGVGDTIRVQFECSPAIPANYVLCTAVAIPWTGSAS